MALVNYNAQQCAHCVKKDLDDLIHFDNPKETRKLDYTERLCEEHTYSALKGKEYRPRYDQSVLEVHRKKLLNKLWECMEPNQILLPAQQT